MKYYEFKNELEEIIKTVSMVPIDMQNKIFQDLYNLLLEDKHYSADSPKNISIEFGELKEFIDSINPSSNIECSTIIVYYLQNKLDNKCITVDSIFSGYNHLKRSIPKNIHQNVRDIASAKYGYVTISDGKIEMTPKGNEYIETLQLKEE